MKFKKVLSISLALAMSISIFAASVSSAESDEDIAQDEAQCFGSIILEKMKNVTSESDSTGNLGNDSGISPQWTGDTHEEIIGDSSNSYIPAAYYDLVVKFCKWCDDKTKIPFATCLHGNQNYVASLKFLWKYAQIIGDKNISGTYSELSANAKNVALAQFDEKYIKRVNPYGNYTQLLTLANTAEYVINNYGKSKDATGRKYLIIGLIMHLLGDVTSHRTIVPKAMVTNAVNTYTSRKPNCLGKNHFTDSNWNTIVSKINSASLDFTNLTSYIIGKKVSYYEDNPNCYYNRILFSETMIEYFLHYFSSGFDDSIFDPVYSNVKLISLTGYKNNITQS